jgi:hypothetical protein
MSPPAHPLAHHIPDRGDLDKGAEIGASFFAETIPASASAPRPWARP